MAGLLNGMLPCGLVVAALATALQPGTWYEGASVMILFGLGTVPMLMVIAFGAQLCTKASWKTAARFAFPILMLGTGVWLIARGLLMECHCHVPGDLSDPGTGLHQHAPSE